MPRVATAQLIIEPRSRAFWIAGSTAVAGAALLDERIQRFVERHDTRSLDRLARPIGYVGQARYIVPSLIASAVLPRIAGYRALSDAAVHVGLGYAVADGIEAVLKRLVGRHRPDSTGRSALFRPLHGGAAWASLPSGHTVHMMSLATGVSIEAHQPWVAAVAYGIGSVVALQRVYTQTHWASDVVGSTVLAISASATTVRFLERRARRPR
jgi:membrane-associated phospholipid phosphatase